MTFPFFRQRRPAPRILELPKTLKRIYAVGDIHGRIDHLEAMESLIAREISEAPDLETAVIYLGDYIDRGPHSAHVLDWLGSAPGYAAPRICLLGNHDQMLLDVVQQAMTPGDWMALGGASTLLSYSGDSRDPALLSKRALRQKISDLIPDRHIQFLRLLPEAAKTETMLFSHAGGDPGKTLQKQSHFDFLDRRPDPSEGENPTKHGMISIHGHMRETIFLDKVFRICVDMTGARGDILGALCVDVENMSRRFLTVRGKEK